MLSQGQFFNTDPYERPLSIAEQREQQQAEQTARHAPQTHTLQAAQHYLDSARMPEGVDPLVGRQARATLNRLHVEDQHGHRGLVLAKVMGKPQYAHTYGVERGPEHFEEPWIPHTFSEHEWRKFGRVEEVPLNRVTAGQPGVAKERVDELRRMPGVGVDPRYSGAMREMPHAVKSTDPSWALHQGHHRVMAEITRPGQQEMLMPMRVVDEPTTFEESRRMTDEITDYRIQRFARVQSARDATMGRGRRPVNR